jgi:hypothetical protein
MYKNLGYIYRNWVFLLILCKEYFCGFFRKPAWFRGSVLGIVFCLSLFSLYNFASFSSSVFLTGGI